VSTVIYFGIPRDLLLTANQRMHWRKKAARTKAIRELADVQTRSFKAEPMQAAHCLVELTWPDKRRRDAHNLMPTIKACIDGIVDAKLLPDDSDKHLTGPDLRVLPNPLKQPGIAVYLTFTFTSWGDAA
jgi:crossover junction endodeoxyribonuclease RusA